ncbi:choice-of-anchor P family protein [Saccharothrix sp. HUAS TT1]|uniref:choice-of-anchor P family protein n=1 Tax=unclassified Saccharothrix TaxID=2593673 RepID=UPI00345BDA00
MRARMTRRAAVAGLVASAALVVGAAPAEAAPGDATAHGASLALSLPDHGTAPSAPFAAADANGPVTGTSAGVDVPAVLSTGAIGTSASRDEKTGGAHSAASAADVRLDLLASVTGGVSADLVEARCSATQKGLTGASELVGLDLGRLGAVDAAPAPGTTVGVDLRGAVVAELVLNEQVRNADGSLTVNALRLTLLDSAHGSGDVVLASATCGPAGLPVPMASGAGLGAGLGLLALFAAPAAAVALRRRRECTAV